MMPWNGAVTKKNDRKIIQHNLYQLYTNLAHGPQGPGLNPFSNLELATPSNNSFHF